MDKIEFSRRPRLPHWRLVLDQCPITPEIRDYPYSGDGTPDDPFVVDWIENDVRNPMNFPAPTKWVLVVTMAFSGLAVALVSSGYVGGINQIEEYFQVDELIATLGVSLYVLGFCLGPMFCAPFSEVYGRQMIMDVTYGCMAFFNIGAIFSQNLATLLILRFLAGTFGSAPLSNTGGVIADVFPASQRGLAMTLYAVAPMLGPVLGPICGGFMGESAGWRYVMVLMGAFSLFCWIAVVLLVPETFAPLLLRKRADKLSKMTGKLYVCHLDLTHGRPDLKKDLWISLTRPWKLFIYEPIVLILTLYMAIIYGTLYMMFEAFPFVFEVSRGWSQGMNGLAFLGMAVGLMAGMLYNWLDNIRYRHLVAKQGKVAPEARLPPMMVAAVALPTGLFWFAWTNGPSIHYMVCICASIFFGLAFALVFVAGKNYLVDSYTIFSASGLASTVIVRSLFGVVFPLFTPAMFENLGLHWASSVPAFMALACTPFPFVFYKYGPEIRKRCKFAREAQEYLQRHEAKTEVSPELVGGVLSGDTALEESAMDDPSEKV